MPALPISFDQDLLPAIKGGHKSVTRRRISDASGLQVEPLRHAFTGMEDSDALFHVAGSGEMKAIRIHCPFGKPGQLLQVPEAPGLVLRVKRVWAEQVRSITEADVLAEGMVEYQQVSARPEAARWFGLWGVPGTCRPHPSAVEAFRQLLATFYPTAWERNEWMWVVEFERVLPSAG